MTTKPKPPEIPPPTGRIALGPALLLATQLCLFLPWSIFVANKAELTTSLPELVPPLALTAVLLLAIVLSASTILPKNLRKRFALLVFGIAILTWMQANLLAWDYGVVGRDSTGSGAGHWRGFLDGTLWLGVLTLCCLVPTRFEYLSRLFSFTLAVLLFARVAFSWIDNPGAWTNEAGQAKLRLPPDDPIYSFSSESNIIHVVLDELGSNVTTEIINSDPQRYDRALRGFTFFSDALGAFPTTVFSIPAFLTGETYDNKIPARQYLHAAYSSHTIVRELSENGYRIDVASPIATYNLLKLPRNHFRIPVTHWKGEAEQRNEELSILTLLATSRSLPYFVRRFILGDGFEILPGAKHLKRKSYVANRSLSDQKFLADLIATMRVDSEQPTYKLIHLTTTHYPAILNERCEYVGKVLAWRWPSLRTQARCSFEHFAEFIEKLRELGVYDNSLIILNADHGYWKVRDSALHVPVEYSESSQDEDLLFESEEHFARVVASSMPTIGIKPFNSVGPLSFSRTPAQLTDIPVTAASLAGIDGRFPGVSLFELREDSSRARPFVYYDRLDLKQREHPEHFDRYLITGPVTQRRSWSLAKQQADP